MTVSLCFCGFLCWESSNSGPLACPVPVRAEPWFGFLFLQEVSPHLPPLLATLSLPHRCVYIICIYIVFICIYITGALYHLSIHHLSTTHTHYLFPCLFSGPSTTHAWILYRSPLVSPVLWQYQAHSGHVWNTSSHKKHLPIALAMCQTPFWELYKY